MAPFRRKQGEEGEEAEGASEAESTAETEAAPGAEPAPPVPDESAPPTPADPGFTEAVEAVAEPEAVDPEAPPTETVADPADLPPPDDRLAERPPEDSPAEPRVAGAEPFPIVPEPVAVEGPWAPEPLATPLPPEPLVEPLPPPPPGGTELTESSPLDLGARPEIYAGAAFVGGLVVAQLLRWVGRRG